MQLENNFVVPVGVDQAWTALNDPERVAPCFPGATLESVDGDAFKGSVKLKLGPISMIYKGTGTFVERDAAARRVVIDATGRDSRGGGQAKAVIIGTLTPQGTSTAVSLITDLTITGKPAQLGRGLIAEVSNKIVGQFAACLSETLGSGPATAAAAGTPGAAPAGAGTPGATPTGTGAVGTARAGAVGGTPTGAEVAPAGAATATPAGRSGGAHAAAEPVPGSLVTGGAATGGTGSGIGEALAGGPEAPGSNTPTTPIPAQGLPVDPPTTPFAAQASRPVTPNPEATAAAAVPESTPAPPAPRRSADHIDLLGTAGPSVAKRLIPAFLVVAVIVIVAIWLLTR